MQTVSSKNNNLKRFLGNTKDKIQNNDELEMYSIYCLDCYKYYVGQTFRYLNIKFKEYLKNIKKQTVNL